MNNQENKNKQSQDNGKGQAPQNSFWKKTFAKRWTFPVIYLAASVLIVGLMYAKSQDASPYEIDNTNKAPEAGPVTPINDVPAEETASTPNFIWPVGEGGEDATVSMDFYRDNESEEARAAAVVMYQNTFTPHQGVDFGLQSDKPFTVVAAAKGKVLSVTEDPLMGNVVEIDHGNGYTTYYASLQGVKVETGSQVLQGEPIAMTGNSKFELSEQNHLHFELRKDGKAIDPASIMGKKPGMSATAPNGDSSSVIGSPAATEPAEKSGDKTDKDATTKPEEKKEEGQSSSTAPESGNSTESGDKDKTTSNVPHTTQ